MHQYYWQMMRSSNHNLFFWQTSRHSWSGACNYYKYIFSKTRQYIILLIILLSIFSCVKESPLNSDNTAYTDGLIAFTAHSDTFYTDLEIYLVDSYDYSPVSINISNSIAVDFYPDWLYDKSALIYISTRGAGSELYKVDPFSFEIYAFFTSDEPIIKISASPAEPKLVYFKEVTNQPKVDLNILDTESLDTLHFNRLSNTNNLQVAWSADGKKLAVKVDVIMVYDMEQNRHIYNIGFIGDYFAWAESGEELYMIRSGNLYCVDTLQQRTIITGMSLAYPAISPDRRYLACVSGNSLIVIDLGFGDYTTIKQVQLPPFESGDYRLVDWSPDSRTISFIDQIDGKLNIFIASRNGFDPIEQVTDDDIVKISICQ